MLKRLVCSALLITAGCSTSYAPRPRPGLRAVLEGGQLDAVKHGQLVDVGRFGGGLVDAVSDDPKALEEAQSFRSMRIGGFVIEMVGLGGVVAGAFVIGLNEGQDKSDGVRLAGYGTMLGGLIVELIGVMIETGANPHFFDAINIYNDNLEARSNRGMPPPGAYPPVQPRPGPYPPVQPPRVQPPPAQPPPGAYPPVQPPPAPGPPSSVASPPATAAPVPKPPGPAPEPR